MRDTYSCKDLSPDPYIREEENQRSNSSSVDTANGLYGASAPPDENCLDFCKKALAEGKIKPEKETQWSVTLPTKP